MKPRLVVIPTDPISLYEKTGYDWLERYFNPGGMFGEVFALSPLEEGERKAHGMTLLRVPERKFSQTLKEIRPNVVRAYGGFWPADLACMNRVDGIPVVVSVHDTRPELLHQSVRYADLVISLTKEVDKRLLAIGADPKRIRRLPNRIDPKVFYPIRNDALLQSVTSRFPAGKHILHVGRRTREKNLDSIIRALALLPPEYSCIFVGLGDRAPFANIAEQLGVSERCFWIDAVKNSELPLWYSWCDCFCLPSRFPSEGFPIVSLEAAACGTPMVVSDIPPMNEYLVHDDSACLVKEYDSPGALAGAIRRVCEDTEYREKLSAGALKLSMQFELSAVDAMEVGIYREALGLGSLSWSRRLEISLWQARERAATSALGTHLKELRRTARRVTPRKVFNKIVAAISKR